MKQRALRILWPAFMVAGVLEAMVFAVIDPADMHWLSGPPLAWSTQAVYTVTFLIFWAAIASASAITAFLSVDRDVLNSLQEGR
jgi:hypothetical protein